MITFVEKCLTENANHLTNLRKNLKNQSQDDSLTEISKSLVDKTKKSKNFNKSTVDQKTKRIKIKREPLDLDEYLQSSSAFVQPKQNERSNSCSGWKKLHNTVCYVCGKYNKT